MQHRTVFFRALRRAASTDSGLNDFLTDMLTPQEYKDILLRWQILTMLNDGVPQRVIAQRLGVSISKITRGSRVLNDGHEGISHLLA